MSLEVVMPQMGESITEGTVSKWLKAVGDKIEKDEPILEISTDKVDAEVPSPGAGTLLEIRVGEGETVEVGSIVGVVGSEQAAVSSQQSAVSSEQSAANSANSEIESKTEMTQPALAETEPEQAAPAEQTNSANSGLLSLLGQLGQLSNRSRDAANGRINYRRNGLKMVKSRRR